MARRPRARSVEHVTVTFTERWQYIPIEPGEYVTDGSDLYRVLQVREGYLDEPAVAVLEDCATLRADVHLVGEVARMRVVGGQAASAMAGRISSRQAG